MPFFRDIIGQNRSIGLLQSFLRKAAIPPSLLFQGEEGIGKRQVAEIFANAILCQGEKRTSQKALQTTSNDGTFIEACHDCLTCRKLKDLNHPGLSIIEPEGKSIKIDQIRQMQSKIIIKPFDGPKKIILIDHADKMNAAAANSLLKTLEEPPPYAILILIASQTSALPPTLLSRCQKIPFHPLSLAQVITILMEKKGWTMAEARLVAALANGNLSEAFSLEVENAREMDKMRYELISSDDLFGTAEKFSKTIETFETALSYLFTWFRDLFVIKSFPSEAHVDPAHLRYSWRYEQLKHWANTMSSDEISTVLADLQDVRKAQLRNVNRRLSLETLLMKIHMKQTSLS